MNTHNIDIFISHSSFDSELAKILIDLIRLALNIGSKNIRCTSVDGYRLPGGVNTDASIREEVNSSKVFIGLITRKSINSIYVLFELGARWGVSKPMIPLFACGADPSILEGPIKNINCLSCDNSAQLNQLIEEIASILDIKIDSTSAYQDKIGEIVQFSEQNRNIINEKNTEPKFEDGVYWLNTNDGKDGPYCPLCWDKDKKLIHLNFDSVDIGEGPPIPNWQCLSCGSNFYVRKL